MKRIHGQPKPAHEAHGLETAPPAPCSFAIGDSVTFTNDQGCEFPGRTVIGFAKEVQSWGGFIHLDKGAWWFPVTPESLTKAA